MSPRSGMYVATSTVASAAPAHQRDHPTISELAQVAPKHLCLHPVKQDEHTVAE
jgi:hypothetical protein